MSSKIIGLNVVNIAVKALHSESHESIVEIYSFTIFVCFIMNNVKQNERRFEEKAKIKYENCV